MTDPLHTIPRDLPSDAYKVGDEFKPFHPSASHVPPDYRDGWNRCWAHLTAFADRIRKDEREACAVLCDDAAKSYGPFRMTDTGNMNFAAATSAENLASAIRSRKP